MDQKEGAGAMSGRVKLGELMLEVRLDASAVMAVIEQLKLDLADAPLQVRKLALDLVDLPFELVGFEQGETTRAGVTVLLKPSQRLLDFAAAVRARDFDHLVV